MRINNSEKQKTVSGDLNSEGLGLYPNRKMTDAEQFQEGASFLLFACKSKFFDWRMLENLKNEFHSDEKQIFH